MLDQVDWGFDVNLDRTAVPSAGRASGVKRKADALVAGSSITERHRSWLKRGRAGAHESTWRPQKSHRLSTKHWLLHTDNQLQVSTKFRGWVDFVATDAWTRDSWASWPHCTVSLDQGSDGLSASFALEYFWKANCTRICDFAHGAHKDLQAALRACGMFDHNSLR